LRDTLFIDGKEKNYLELSEEELERVKALIKPRLKDENGSLDAQNFLFFIFKIFYQRKYKDSIEEQDRFKIFQSSLKKINEINSKNKSFRVAINKFADRRDEELPMGLRSSPMSNFSPKDSSQKSEMNEEDYMEQVQKGKSMLKGILNMDMSRAVGLNEDVVQFTVDNASDSKGLYGVG
jgi:hypothetical protein